MLAASTSADGTVASQTHVGGGRPGEPLLRQESALMEDQVVDLARRELHRPWFGPSTSHQDLPSPEGLRLI